MPKGKTRTAASGGAVRLRSAPRDRGILARPLDSLVFLLPLLLFFEGVSLFIAWPVASPQRVVAYAMVLRFLELFGHFGLWAPALVVVIILIATHASSGERWTVHWPQVGRMYVESIALAVPLLLLNLSAPLTSVKGGSSGLPAGVLAELALGIGAGIYEELVFRLLLVTLIFLIGVDLLGLPAKMVAVVGIVLSALVFSAHHHPPLGIEPFALGRFVFRSLAGLYLAVIFWYRGYGPAAGCHAAYNVVLVSMEAAQQG